MNCLLFLMLLLQPPANSSKLDSLINRLDGALDPETEMAINQSIFDVYVDERLPDDTTLVKLLNKQAFLHWRTNPAKLDSLANVALKKAENIGFIYGVADAQYMIGFYYDLIGSYDDALKYYFTALESMKALDQPEKVATISEYIGIVYRFTGDYEASLKFYLEALSLYEDRQDSSRIGNALNSLGNLYFDQSEFNKAEKYYYRSLAIKRKHSPPNSIANTLGNISTIKRKKGELAEALILAEEVASIKKQVNNTRDLAGAYVSLSNIHEDLGDLAKADSLMELAVAIDRQVNHKQALTGDLRQLARIKRTQGNTKIAKALLKEAEGIALEVGTLNNLRSIYEERIMIDTALENYQDAFLDLLKIVPLNDSLSNEEMARNMARLEADYDFNLERDSITFANEKEKVLLQSELELQRRTTYAYIGGLLLVSALALVSWLLYREKITANKKLTELNEAISVQKEELEQVNRTKDRLFSIVAHDLRNPLAALQGIATLLDPKILSEEDITKTRKELLRRINGIGDVMENLLIWARDQMEGEVVRADSFDVFTLSNEIIQLYETIGEEKGVSLTNEVDPGSLVFADINHIRVVLRNLIGNAIKFTSASGSIKISSAREENGCLTIQVRDTGIGMDQRKVKDLFTRKTDSTAGTSGEKGIGLGLVLVKEYIEKNHGTVRVESYQGEGTSFFLTLPAAQSEPAIHDNTPVGKTN